MWIKFAIALIPIIWLIISLGVMRMSAARACIIGLVLTVLLAIFSFKLSTEYADSSPRRNHHGYLADHVRNRGSVICVQCDD